MRRREQNFFTLEATFSLLWPAKEDFYDETQTLPMFCSVCLICNIYFVFLLNRVEQHKERKQKKA